MQNVSNPLDGADIAYLDFEIEIGSGSGRDYPVAVVRSPAGEAEETMHFPFDELALDNRLKDLQIALLRSGGSRRQALSAEEQHVQAFGRDLFNALLTGEVRSRYDISCREARQQGKGLRLKLRIQPPELAALPWEFLYDPRQAEYVCLSLDTPLIRYLELPQPVQPLFVTPPLRILGMIASPRDLPALDVARERQRLEAAVRTLQADGLVNLTWLEGQTWSDLQRALRSGPWHIFHFIGHGGFDRQTDEGMVALADENGVTHFLRATELARLLADHHSLRLVLLNSCEGARSSERDIFSSTAAILVRRGIPAVLAMQYEITDRAAIEFTRTFYEALATKLPIDAAVTEARKAISLAVTNSIEWGTPVLYMRAPQGIIFQVSGALSDRQLVPSHQAGLDQATAERLERLYIEGLNAFGVGDWEQACHAFQTVLDESPDYPNAAAKLAEARDQRQSEIAALYSEAVRLLQMGQPQAALDKWREVQARDPHYPDRQKVEAKATQKLKQLSKPSKPTHHLVRWVLVIFTIAVLGIILVLVIRRIVVPSSMYDDFSDLVYDGRFNPEKWEMEKFGSNSVSHVSQASRYLSIAQEGSKESELGTELIARQSLSLPLNDPMFFETRISLVSPENGGGGMTIHTNAALYGCKIVMDKPSSPQVHWAEEDGREYRVIAQKMDAELDRWYTCRADFFPREGRIDFYLDGKKVGSRQSIELNQLYGFSIGVHTPPGSSGTLISHFDDVRIGPVE